MPVWELLSDRIAGELWDKYLSSFHDATYFQSYDWGEHRRCFGWIPFRWVACGNGGEVVSLVQAIYRPYRFGVGLLWSSGGPVGDISTWGDDLRKVVLESTGAKHLYYRFFSNRKATQVDQEILESQGWQRCPHRLRSGLSMSLRLDREPEEMRLKFSRDWRYNLRQFEKSNACIRRWTDPDIDEILMLYDAMESYKGLEQQFSRGELQDILDRLRDRVIFYRCDDQYGQLVAFRGCIVVGRVAWDVFAATSVAGRKLRGVSNALMWAVLQHCHQAGVKEYDLMGIDPVGSPGVYNFKKGTGAEFIEYLGEWEWATNRALRWGANIAVYRKRSHA